MLHLSTMNQTRSSMRSSDSYHSGSAAPTNQRFNSRESISAFGTAPQKVEEVEAPIFQMSNNELMQFRWLKQLSGSIPAIDMQDVNAVLADPQAGRQFAAEFSQSSYEEMLC